MGGDDADKNGCVKKSDGLWCPQAGGFWVNQNTGKMWRATETDKNGCVKKYDGLWCPQAGGSWVNKDTGYVASKEDVDKCVQKEDGLWCPYGPGTWVNTDTGSVFWAPWLWLVVALWWLGVADCLSLVGVCCVRCCCGRASRAAPRPRIFRPEVL